MTQLTVATGPGARLQKRREALGLSLQQAAAQLNLKAAVIEQLESQQWDPKVGPTFIRGYLRQYCRLLKLDESALLAEFDQLLAAMPAATPMHSFSKKTSRDAAESRFMLATYFLLVLLIGLFLVWFWQTHMLNSQPVSMLPELSQTQNVVNSDAGALRSAADNNAQSPSSGDAAAAPTPEAVTAGNTATQPQTGQTAEVATAPVPSAAETSAVVLTPAADTTVPSAQPAVTPDVTPATPEPTDVQTAVAPGAEVETPPVSMTENQPAAVAEVSLQLQFSAPCWVAVTDATGRRLAYNMQNSAQTLSVTGVPPLNVTLGDPAAVTATVRGNPIDLSGYKQGQVARLTINGSE